MQPENDKSTGTDPSTADLADTGSVAPGPEGEVAEGTPAPQEERAEGVAESGAGSTKVPPEPCPGQRRQQPRSSDAVTRG